MKATTSNGIEKTLRLISKKRKGVLRVIFSRFGFAVLLLIIQLCIIVSVYNRFNSYFKWFNGALWIFTIIMLIHLFKSDMDSTAKLTWLLLMSMFPIPSSIFLWFTEKDIGHRALKARLQELIYATKDKLIQKDEILSDPEIISSATDDLCRYLNNSGCFPIYKDTEVEYFKSGEEKFNAMLEELKKAEKYIYLEYFIIDEGLMWGSILKILADKAAAGVDVRVMYDGMCEISTLSSDYPKRLAKLGIKCKPFSPIHPFISTHYNYRDHRKILVIDGKAAFNGGVNLADEYINHIERFGHWKDTAVMIKGDAVKSFVLMFLQMWNINEQTPDWNAIDEISGADCHNNASDGFVMPYCDCPLDEYKTGECVYIDILNRAKEYVHICTPYLILDNELETALKFCALRGVDVKLILPGIPDKKAAYSLAKSHYKYLINAGVKIYEYTPGFIHAKSFVSDDEKAVVGTINLEYRSLYHHFECATYLYRTNCISDIEDDFNQTLAKCRQVTPETVKREKLSYKILGGFMKLVAPLM